MTFKVGPHAERYAWILIRYVKNAAPAKTGPKCAEKHECQQQNGVNLHTGSYRPYTTRPFPTSSFFLGQILSPCFHIYPLFFHSDGDRKRTAAAADAIFRFVDQTTISSADASVWSTIFRSEVAIMELIPTCAPPHSNTSVEEALNTVESPHIKKGHNGKSGQSWPPHCCAAIILRA